MSSSVLEKSVLRVLVCDPDPLTRVGVRGLVDSVGCATVVGENAGIDLDLAVSDPVYDVAVISHGGVPSADRDVVLFVDLDDRRALADAVKAGATRLVNRANAATDLGAALQAVFDGHPYLSASLTGPFFTLLAAVLPHRGSAVAATDHLSPREAEVLLLVGEGRSNVDIARKLGIQETTVRSHMAGILGTLNIATRAEAVLIGYDMRVEMNVLAS